VSICSGCIKPYCEASTFFSKFLGEFYYSRADSDSCVFVVNTQGMYYQDLVIATCEAILSDTPAYRSWIKHYFFRCCIKGITEDSADRCWHPNITNAHLHFLDAQATLKIWRYTHGHKVACDHADRYVSRYKARIMRIIPLSRHWNYNEWIDESNIFREILHIYKLDFSCNPTAYAILHQLLDYPTAIPEKIDSPAINSLIRLDICSPTLLSALWPIEHPNSITKLFLLAEKTARYWIDVFSNEVCDKDGWCPKDYSYTYLSQSWLFAYIQKQLYSEKISHCYVSKVKQAILNVELRS